MDPQDKPSHLAGILRGRPGGARPLDLVDLTGSGSLVELPENRGGLDPQKRRIEDLEHSVKALQASLESLRKTHEAALAAGREEAYQRGLKDGTAAGEATGKAIAAAQAERRLSEIDSSVRSRLEAVERSLDQVFLDWESRVLELSMAIARRIVGEACSVPGMAASHIARMALRKLGAEARVVVRCHPADLTTLEREKELWGTRSGRRVSLEPDESVGRGGVVIETDTGTIDARVPRLTENVERALAEAVAEERARGGVPS
ncbi:MAG TPA: FliH/SctL family protein [Fibrobacteria bacterium]|nr:FliH/SctL family protein [Fibrobacteria bacterium]HOX50097.1 FliH/SctL family protein [Fibrobacteria bacterium]